MKEEKEVKDNIEIIEDKIIEDKIIEDKIIEDKIIEDKIIEDKTQLSASDIKEMIDKELGNFLDKIKINKPTKIVEEKEDLE